MTFFEKLPKKFSPNSEIYNGKKFKLLLFTYHYFIFIIFYTLNSFNNSSHNTLILIYVVFIAKKSTVSIFICYCITSILILIKIH